MVVATLPRTVGAIAFSSHVVRWHMRGNPEKSTAKGRGVGVGCAKSRRSDMCSERSRNTRLSSG